MADEDYSFYNNDQITCIAKCLDVPLPLTSSDKQLTSSDKQLIRRSQIKPNFASSSACPSEMETESAADNVFESELTTSKFITGSSNTPVSSQNCKRWSNLARVCERYQLSDRAAAAFANSVFVDVGVLTNMTKLV